MNLDFILCNHTLNFENAHENYRYFLVKWWKCAKNNHSCSWILFRKNWIHCCLTPRTLSLLLLASSVMNIFALNLLLQYSFSCLYINRLSKKLFFKSILNLLLVLSKWQNWVNISPLHHLSRSSGRAKTPHRERESQTQGLNYDLERTGDAFIQPELTKLTELNDYESDCISNLWLISSRNSWFTERIL